jgi:putative transposase
MHRNPVVRGLVLEPEQWQWSSYRHYALGEPGPVLINEAQTAEMRVRQIA